MRARAEHYLVVKAPTKRALIDEARYSQANTINEILVDEKLTRGKNVTEDAFVQHYTTLFGPAVLNIEDFKHDFIRFLPRLDDDVKNTLEEPTMLAELDRAIGNLKERISPGPHGFGAVFYRSFSDILAPFLYRVLSEAFEAGVLPLSFSRTHTVLIPKSDDRTKL